MAFWGIEVKPGRPYTHSSKHSNGRLRISQATLGIGTAQLKSSVQCNVGDKRPVLLCVLLPTKTESLQLDLEFNEAEDVIFSVIGPRAVYLTGYHVGHNRHSVFPVDSESFGEDIENSVSRDSNNGSDDYEYDDSFINDDESEPRTASPASSNRDDHDDDDKRDLMKTKKVNGGYKRLTKRYQSIVSDDEESVPDSVDSDDFKISSIFKRKTQLALGEQVKEETLAELKKKTENNESEGNGDNFILSMTSLAEVKPEENKEKQEPSKDDKGTKKTQQALGEKVKEETLAELKKKTENNESEGKGDNFILSMPSLAEVNPEGSKKNQESSKDDKATNALAVKDDQKLAVMGEVSNYADVDSEKKSKPKKKRKGHSEVNIDVTDNNLLAGNKLDDGQYATNENQSAEKKVKRKRIKPSKTQETEVNTNINVEDNKKTLSNGLVIEDLVTGNSEGKVAAAGRKVKVQYVVKLKENGHVLNSNNNAPHKFRLGDKKIIEGLNVGLEGMRVGDRRRLTIPPSMSLGYEGDGENVPPNSWLVFDVEMTSIH